MKTANKKAPKVTVTIQDHPRLPDMWACTVETARGLVYSIAWAWYDEAGTPPTEAMVLEVWRTDRKAFNPGYCS